MAPIDELTILVPVDVSESGTPALGVLEFLRPIEVVLLGYFPVPDQAEPALIKGEYESEAAARLDRIAGDRDDLTEVLVFTHDREATIDRVADQYGCDAVVTAGEAGRVDRILVPLRGDANLQRIVAVVADLLGESDAIVTLFHSTAADADPSGGELLLRGATERLTDHGIDPGRIDRRVSEGGDPHADIVAAGNAHDLVVLGETEPTLRERIIGDALGRIVDDLEVPALVVRDVE